MYIKAGIILAKLRYILTLIPRKREFNFDVFSFLSKGCVLFYELVYLKLKKINAYLLIEAELKI
ncbi:hypothetical protein BUQ74_01645 [Leptospira weilii serovar Heyan]|nr:hypothetical protein BUQ74_01645 [Leptospira weilii serovar Heyan]